MARIFPAKPLLDLSADNTVVEIGTGMHNLHAVEAQNLNAVDLWLHFWDLEAADITIGVDDPTVSLLIPAGDGALYGAMDKDWSAPIGFAKGLCYAVTDAPDGGAAPATAAVLNILYRKIRVGD